MAASSSTGRTRKARKSRAKYPDKETREMAALVRQADADRNFRAAFNFNVPAYQAEARSWMGQAQLSRKAFRERPLPPSGYMEYGRAGMMKDPRKAHRRFTEHYDAGYGQVMLVPVRTGKKPAHRPVVDKVGRARYRDSVVEMAISRGMFYRKDVAPGRHYSKYAYKKAAAYLGSAKPSKKKTGYYVAEMPF